MTRWTQWPKGLLVCGATSLTAAGCLSDDPNMDGVTMTGTSDPSGSGTGNEDPTVGPPVTTVDDTATDDGPTDDGPEPTGEPEGTTIYDIQMGSVAPGLVTISDVVVVSPVELELGKMDEVTNGLAFVQEAEGGPYSGILIYLYTDVAMGVPLSPGDVVTITGEYDEYFDESQITITSVDGIVPGGMGTVPAPADVAPGDVVFGSADAEGYEGVPVCLANVTATDATNMFGDFHVDENMAVTNMFLFGTPDFLDVLPGTEFATLCGPIRFTFDEYKIAPRGAADYDATLVGCADAAPPATIYDVQQGMFTPGDLVLLQDVIVTTPFNFDGDGFFVQEAGGGEYSGISVYLPSAGGFVPSPGDVVTICGEYDEFFDQSQLEVASGADVMVTGNGPAPAPDLVTSDEVGGGASAEAWEGVLVRIENATVTTEANMFGEWEVDGALLLDDLFFDMGSWPEPPVDTVYASITGVMTFSFENYKLAPRTEADLEQ
jgi:predicted extracellular nuclease